MPPSFFPSPRARHSKIVSLFFYYLVERSFFYSLYLKFYGEKDLSLFSEKEGLYERGKNRREGGLAEREGSQKGRARR